MSSEMIHIEAVQEASDGSFKIAFSPAGSSRLSSTGPASNPWPYPCAEAVLLINNKGRTTACLSSQIGCAMGCRFCQTAALGLIGNLNSSQIVAQFDALNNEAQKRGLATITNVVFMGMGEALQNFNALKESIQILQDHKGRNIFPRRITVSTSGHIPGIKKLAELKPVPGLAFSLISGREEIRSQLIPNKSGHSLADYKAALMEYTRAVNKRISLEVILFKGINCGEDEVEAIANFTEGLDCIVNVIPWNPIINTVQLPIGELAAPDEETVHNFAMMLSKKSVPNSVRFTRARDVNAACGQLGSFMHKKNS